VRAVAFNDSGILVTGGLDMTVRAYAPQEMWSSENFGTRFRQFESEVQCIVMAPCTSSLAGLAALGTTSGTIHFVDFSTCDQQPTFAEAVKVIKQDRLEDNHFRVTREMIERYPFVVNSADASGSTLYHYAVNREDSRLLKVLLTADIPRFFLPVNFAGHDALYKAAAVRSRPSIRQLLKKINESKRIGRLAPISNAGTRYLSNLIKISEEFYDLVADFLVDFGLDEVPYSSIAQLSQLVWPPSFSVVQGSEEKSPANLWLELHKTTHVHKATFKLKRQSSSVRVKTLSSSHMTVFIVRRVL
jgi:hypothetical protein